MLWLLAVGCPHRPDAVDPRPPLIPHTIGVAELGGEADLARWAALAAQDTVLVAGEPRPLGSAEVFVGGVLGLGEDCVRFLDPKVRADGGWVPVPWPADGELDLRLRADGDVVRGRAQVTGDVGPTGTMRLMVWGNWGISDLTVDGRRAEYARDGADVVVAAPEGRHVVAFRIASASEGPTLIADDRVNLLAVAHPWAPGWRTVRVEVDGIEPLEWVGGNIVQEGSRAIGTWEGPRSYRWVASGSTGSVAIREEAVSVTTPRALEDHQARLVAKLRATVDAAAALGLDPPDTLDVVFGTQRFSYAGPPVVLSEADIAEPSNEFVVAHELGHHLFPPIGSGREPSEAYATWVSGWAADTDGGTARRWWVPTSAAGRCPLLFGRSRPSDDSGLLLSALADHMGQEALLAAVQRRRDDDWGALLDVLPPAEAAWLTPWLMAPRWPLLSAHVDAEGLWIEDVAATGVSATVDVAFRADGADEVRTRVPFGPGSGKVAVPAGVDPTALVLVDPEVRLPVVVAKPAVP
jgi:hypothetical protein